VPNFMSIPECPILTRLGLMPSLLKSRPSYVDYDIYIIGIDGTGKRDVSHGPTGHCDFSRLAKLKRA